MPHHDSHASGSLDNSGCKRLRISSLVCDMSAEHEKYVLFASGGDLVDELRSKGFHTNMWETMLTSAFNEASAPVDALHTVIGLLRKKLDALQGGPAPAAPSPPAAPPANSAPAVNSVHPAASLRPSLAAPPPPELADPPPKRRRPLRIPARAREHGARHTRGSRCRRGRGYGRAPPGVQPLTWPRRLARRSLWGGTIPLPPGGVSSHGACGAGSGGGVRWPSSCCARPGSLAVDPSKRATVDHEAISRRAGGVRTECGPEGRCPKTCKECK